MLAWTVTFIICRIAWETIISIGKLYLWLVAEHFENSARLQVLADFLVTLLLLIFVLLLGLVAVLQITIQHIGLIAFFADLSIIKVLGWLLLIFNNFDLNVFKRGHLRLTKDRVTTITTLSLWIFKFQNRALDLFLAMTTVLSFNSFVVRVVF